MHVHYTYTPGSLSTIQYMYAVGWKLSGEHDIAKIFGLGAPFLPRAVVGRV